MRLASRLDEPQASRSDRRPEQRLEARWFPFGRETTVLEIAPRLAVRRHPEYGVGDTLEGLSRRALAGAGQRGFGESRHVAHRRALSLGRRCHIAVSTDLRALQSIDRLD